MAKKAKENTRCLCSRMVIITPTGKRKKGKKVICQNCKSRERDNMARNITRSLTAQRKAKISNLLKGVNYE